MYKLNLKICWPICLWWGKHHTMPNLMTLVKHRKRRSELRKRQTILAKFCMHGGSELCSLKFFAKYTPEVINKMLSKLVTNEWIDEKGTIPLQPSAKVINTLKGKRRAPAVTKGSKKGRRKWNGLSTANVVIYIQNQKCLWDHPCQHLSGLCLPKGRPMDEAQLKWWGCWMSLEFRIREDGCVL